MVILNLTQHPATAEQIAAGVVDLPPDARAALQAALTFEALPSAADIAERAHHIATLAVLHASADDRGDTGGFALSAIIGGAPYLMAPLERALLTQGIIPLYAFSVRESAEETLPDGSVKKTNVFRHVGFVQVG